MSPQENKKDPVITVTFLALLLNGLDVLAVGGVAFLECQFARAHVRLGIALAPGAARVAACFWRKVSDDNLLLYRHVTPNLDLEMSRADYKTAY